MKRRRQSGGSVTGGTGDVKPQFLTVAIPAPTATDDYVVVSAILPIVRPVADNDEAIIVELLRADWYLMNNDGDIASNNGGYLSPVSFHATGDTATAASAMADIQDPRTTGAVHSTNVGVTSGTTNYMLPIPFDFTDENGNGVLWGVDRMLVTAYSYGNTALTAGCVKILYRYVKVGLVEYLGIVQGQQSANI